MNDKVAAIPNIDRDEARAFLEERVRRLADIAEHASLIASYRKRMYDAYVAAGFDDYDARHMSADGVPFFGV